MLNLAWIFPWVSCVEKKYLTLKKKYKEKCYTIFRCNVVKYDLNRIDLNCRVTIFITIHLFNQYKQIIRRDHRSYIIHAPCYNCLRKCPLVNTVSGNISSTIFSARWVSKLLFFDFLWEIMTLDFPSVFDVCRNMSLELYLHDTRTLIKR